MRCIVRFLSPLVLSSALTASMFLVPAHAGSRLLEGFPLLKQQHPLTCESSAASMGTRGRVTEAQIMAAMPRNPNPNLGFRGNPDGVQGTKLVDYGVYASPVHRALVRFGYQSDILTYAGDGTLRSYLDQGWPVVAWITYRAQPAQPRLAWANGTQFFLVPHEHAVLVVGYDARSVTANDPWTASRARYDWRSFNRAWGYFGDMALAVEPCPAPQPVTGLRVAFVSSEGLRWTWHAGANAVEYHVRVTRIERHNRTLFDGTQTARSFELTQLAPGGRYEIAVQSISSCNGTSSAQRLWVQLPAVLPTPVGTPPEGTVPPSGTPLPTPGGTVTPVPSRTTSPAASATPTPRS